MAHVITFFSMFIGLVLHPLLVSAATSVVDQQQPTIDSTIGALYVGGNSEQKLAQVVTAGESGSLVEVRLPVSCSSGNLVVEIQNVVQDMPGGDVLTSQTFSGSGLPGFFPGLVEFRSLGFATPVRLDAGERFAVVLTSAGECAVYQGPVGDSYGGGEGYFDARPNPPGWVCICDHVGASFDLPFQTVVELDPFIAVVIDVKPGGYPNCVNLAAGGAVPVAIFGSADFDVTTVDPLTIALSGAGLKLKGNGEALFSYEDLNHDGMTDLMVHIETDALLMSVGDHSATLEGITVSGEAIRGTDSVRIVNDK